MTLRSMSSRCVATLIALAACNSPREGVKSHGPIEVGGSVPSYGAASQAGETIGPTKPAGRFHVHVVDDQLPPVCLNEECGPAGKLIAEQGGTLVGGSDGKLAKAFGVELVSPKPYRLDNSVVVFSDQKATIVAIYVGARLADVPELEHPF